MIQAIPQTPGYPDVSPVVRAMDGQGVNNIIALTAALIAFVSFCVAVWVYARTERRERRIEKSTAYLDLEVHSSEAFRYQADNADTMSALRVARRPAAVPAPGDPAWETTLNYYFLCLNLFEVCANFRRNSIVRAEVFASWVAWFHDILSDWYFQSIWRSELRNNYTRDVRNIFDVGVEIFERETDLVRREREFYLAVAYLIGGCHVVESWLDELSTGPIWPPSSSRRPIIGSLKTRYRPLALTGTRAEAPVKRSPLTLDWNAPDDAAPAAAFAGRVISQSVDYISHGEIQTALSPDGRRWADNLADLYAADFAALTDRDLLVARTADGAIAAVAILAWEETPRRRFAVIEDMAVEPQLRSAGVGTQMIEAITERARERGVEWMFLESGLKNARAHEFYRHHGFAEVSHVFARHLN